MIHLTEKTNIQISVQPIDFRRQINGLVALCQHYFHCNPRSGTSFVFRNRAKTMIRFLHYDGSGYWVSTKRLSQGRFTGWPSHDEPMTSLSAVELVKIVKKNHLQ